MPDQISNIKTDTNIGADKMNQAITETESSTIPVNDSKPSDGGYLWLLLVLSIAIAILVFWFIKRKSVIDDDDDQDEVDSDQSNTARSVLFNHLKQYYHHYILHQHNMYKVSYSIPFEFTKLDNPVRRIGWLQDLGIQYTELIKRAIAEIADSIDNSNWSSHLKAIYEEIERLAELAVIEESVERFSNEINDEYKEMILGRKKILHENQDPSSRKIMELLKQP